MPIGWKNRRVRALVQRVTRARVTVRIGSGLSGGPGPPSGPSGPGDQVVVGEIGPGLCVFVGVTHDDDKAAARKLAEKIWRLRVFDDDEGQMNLAVSETGWQRG